MSHLKNQIKTKLHYFYGDGFEEIALTLLKHIYNSENLVQIHANVSWWGQWDGWIDYFNHNERIWFSVYWQKEWTLDPEWNFKAKIKSDYTKATTNKHQWNFQKWIFICNKFELGQEHHKILNHENPDFCIDIYDLDKLSEEILNVPQGKEVLFWLGIISEEDIVLECKNSTITELSNKDRPGCSVDIKSRFDDAWLTEKIDTELVSKWIITLQDIQFAEDSRYTFLQNYIPLLLDGWIYSEMLGKWEIESRFIENLNSNVRKISKEYDDMEWVENCICEIHESSKSSYRNLNQDCWITEKYLLNNDDSVKWCFYQQIINESCDLQEGSNENILILTEKIWSEE